MHDAVTSTHNFTSPVNRHCVIAQECLPIQYTQDHCSSLFKKITRTQSRHYQALRSYMPRYPCSCTTRVLILCTTRLSCSSWDYRELTSDAQDFNPGSFGGRLRSESTDSGRGSPSTTPSTPVNGEEITLIPGAPLQAEGVIP